MRSRRFKQVDVFTDTAYLGNALAVVLDGDGLSEDAMQRFARWTNLSETTFLLPPTEAAADYRVRIFTPGGELPFAGHPTLGSCHAWLEAGGQARAAGHVVQQCAVGLVTIKRDRQRELQHDTKRAERFAFAAPPLRRSQPEPALLGAVAEALGLQPKQILAAQRLDNGPVFLGLLLDSPETVLQLEPDHAALVKLQIKVGVAGVYADDSANAPPLIGRINREAAAFAKSVAPAQAADETPRLEVRGFCAATGINEDPVTGSLNASLAQWLICDGYLPERYLASQGVCVGRAGQVYIQRDAAGQVWVGGQSVSCIDGSVTL
ncbi:MAG: PhzF family phenazine biosynthesis protein [Polaromonas sp.]|nr:PhzF family phenazine biosynthesis protein [Polaromonas sp.]